MLRSIVDESIPSAEEFFVNSTPGGLFHHIESELVADKGDIKKLVLLAGSNDLQFGVERAVNSCRNLFKSILHRHKHAQVNT